MSAKYLLDSWAVLAYLKKESPADLRVLRLLEKARDGEAQLFLSVINLGEIYYIVGRARGEETAQYILDEIKKLPIEILHVEEKDVLAAAAWKMKRPMAYADAFAASAAQELQAILLTGDPELLALRDLIEIEILERS